ncbi:MAG: helix-turn-helix domain-containing protein, partial [Solirubrobacteraceae bacterium]
MSLGDSTSHKSFGEELRDCRKAAGVRNQKEVADFIREQLGASCSVSTVSAWERGETKPRELTVRKVRQLAGW